MITVRKFKTLVGNVYVGEGRGSPVPVVQAAGLTEEDVVKLTLDANGSVLLPPSDRPVLLVLRG